MPEKPFECQKQTNLCFTQAKLMFVEGNSCRFPLRGGPKEPLCGTSCVCKTVLFAERIAPEGTTAPPREVIGHMKPVRCAKLPLSGDMEHASREVKGHMKSVRHRNFHQDIFVAITIAIVVDIIAVNIIHPSIHLSIHRIFVIIMA